MPSSKLIYTDPHKSFNNQITMPYPCHPNVPANYSPYSPSQYFATNFKSYQPKNFIYIPPAEFEKGIY